MSIPAILVLGAIGKIGGALVKELFPDVYVIVSLSTRMHVGRQSLLGDDFPAQRSKRVSLLRC